MNQALLTEMQNRLATIHQGGGQKSIEKVHAKGKLTARERIAYLIDANTEFSLVL